MSSGTRHFWALIKNLKLSKRNFGQNQSACENKTSLLFKLRKLVFEWSEFNKYGLYTHDVIDYDHPVVREALRRLPKNVLDARNFRYKVSLSCFAAAHINSLRFTTDMLVDGRTSTSTHISLCCFLKKPIIRAMQLDFLKIRLPREKWITFEQDIEYRYLSPYMKEIEAEQAEIRKFGCLNYNDEDWPAGEVK